MKLGLTHQELVPWTFDDNGNGSYAPPPHNSCFAPYPFMLIEPLKVGLHFDPPYNLLFFKPYKANN
jgi:hypothetical protein